MDPLGAAIHVLVVYNEDQGEATGEGDDEPPSSREADLEVIEVAHGVAAALEARGIHARLLGLRDGVGPLEEAVSRGGVEAVFNLVESLGGDAQREGEVPEALERLGVPYTGNGARALRIAIDKGRVREALTRRGVPVAPGGVVATGAEALALVASAGLVYPLFVKPACCDASIGVTQESCVRDDAALVRQVERLRRVGDGRSVVESYLPGAELNVALWPDPQGASSVRCMDFYGFGDDLLPIITYDCKWTPESPEYQARSLPAEGRVPEAAVEAAVVAARAALLAIGAEGYGRVDLRLDAAGVPRVMDINPNPDLHPEAGFALAAAARGYTYPELIGMLLQRALERSPYAYSPLPGLRPSRAGFAPGANP